MEREKELLKLLMESLSEGWDGDDEGQRLIEWFESFLH